MNSSFKIGDLFPQETRKKSVDEKIQRGLIIYSYFNDLAVKHEKFFILIAIFNTNVYGFFINSEHPIIAMHNDEIKRMQIELKQEDYAILSKPISYINCSRFIKQPFQDFYNMLIESPAKIYGQLKENHLKLIDDAIKSSKLYSKRDQDILLYEFDS